MLSCVSTVTTATTTAITIAAVILAAAAAATIAIGAATATATVITVAKPLHPLVLHLLVVLALVPRLSLALALVCRRVVKL